MGEGQVREKTVGIGTDGAGGGTDVGEKGCSAWSWGRTLETAGTIAALLGMRLYRHQKDSASLDITSPSSPN